MPTESKQNNFHACALCHGFPCRCHLPRPSLPPEFHEAMRILSAAPQQPPAPEPSHDEPFPQDEWDEPLDAHDQALIQRGWERFQAALEGWQRMELAPQDGTFVDLWMQTNAPPHQWRVTDVRWEADPGGWFKADGRRVDVPEIVVTGREAQSRVYQQPTHWRPRPRPPHESAPEPSQAGDVEAVRRAALEEAACEVRRWALIAENMEQDGDAVLLENVANSIRALALQPTDAAPDATRTEGGE